MAKKRETRNHDFYASIQGNNSDGWFLHYWNLNDEKQIMRLDAEDENDARSEAASYLGIEEYDVAIEYD